MRKEDFVFGWSWKVYKVVGWLTFVICFLLNALVVAQIKTQIDTTDITIGEPIHLEIQLPLKEGQKVVWVSTENPSIAPLEIVESRLDTVQNKEKKTLVQRLRLTSFEAGNYSLSSLPIVVDEDTLLTAAFQITVHDVEIDSSFLTGFPIKPIMEEELTAMDYYKEFQFIVLALAVILLLIVLLVYLYFRRKKQKIKVPIPLSPYEEAKLSLRNLDQQDHLKQQAIYPYYSSLSYILRKYLGRVYDFPSLELLSDDLVEYMRKLAVLDAEQLSELKQFLHDADLVKFAKATPAPEKHLQYRKSIEAWIEQIKPLDLEATNPDKKEE